MGLWWPAAYSASRYLTGSYAKEAPRLLLFSLLLLLVWPEPEGRGLKDGAGKPEPEGLSQESQGTLAVEWAGGGFFPIHWVQSLNVFVCAFLCLFLIVWVHINPLVNFSWQLYQIYFE